VLLEDSWLSKALWQERIHLPEKIRPNLRHNVSLLQRAGCSDSAMQRWPRTPRDGRVLLDFEQDWDDHRPISRSSVKPRRTGDCMMNVSLGSMTLL
jgi:hypothetical protein